MKRAGTLLLKRSEVAALLTLHECMLAVEHAFGLHAEGRIAPPGILGLHAGGGGFHIKAGLWPAGRSYFAAKTNSNFPENMKLFGLPLIQGIIALFDAENGYPLALMDSIEITIIRTGAATGTAARHLARTDARIATICGCGNQGRVSLRALAEVRPLTRAYVWDIDRAQSRRFASELSGELGIRVEAVDELAAAVPLSDICVTCTPSKRHFLEQEYVKPGTFVAAVGADSDDKQEIDPRLVASNKLVVDSLDQCAAIGDLHHALDLGLITRENVYGELGDVIAGKKSGRQSHDEIIIFDSTGTALQDVAASALVYERAVTSGAGAVIDLRE